MSHSKDECEKASLVDFVVFSEDTRNHMAPRREYSIVKKFGMLYEIKDFACCKLLIINA